MKFSIPFLKRGTRNAERWDNRSTITGSAMRPVMPKMTPDHMAAYRMMEKIVRAYDAAVTDNYNSDFRGTYGSPNTEILPHRYTVRARARTLAKDTPHGKAVVRTFQNNVVGAEPFKLEMKVGDWKRKSEAGGRRPEAQADGELVFVEDKELNLAIEAEWNDFIKKENFTTRKTMSFMEAMRVVEAELVAPGSVICRLHDAYPYNRWGFAVDFLEEDRLQETYVGNSGPDSLFGPGNPIRGSVEYHPQYEFPLAYWLLKRHPGEAFGNMRLQPELYGSRTGADQVYREQVPAQDIIHFNNLRDRAEQDIGMTELDATVQPLWRIHQYEKSLTLSSIASAAKPWWIERKYPTGFQVPEGLREQVMNSPGLSGMDGIQGSSESRAADGDGVPVNEVAPGARETLPPGFELKQADPKFPIEAAHDFRLDNLRDIAVGTGISYQHASGDFQNLGFIAGLMCQIPFQDHCKVRQKNLVDGGIDRIFKRWLKASLMKGVFDFPLSRLDEICRAAHFKGKGFQFVNPLVQAQALILLNQAGHMTRQQVQDQLPDGMSFEKLVHDLANEQAEMDKHGLHFGEPEEAGQMPEDETERGGEADRPEKSSVQRPRSRAHRALNGGRRLKLPHAALL